MAYSLRSSTRSSSQTPAGEKEPLTFHTASERLLSQGRERDSPKEKSARVDDGPSIFFSTSLNYDNADDQRKSTSRGRRRGGKEEGRRREERERETHKPNKS